MSGVKRLLEEIWERGADFVGDEYVCAACIEDKALKEFVRENVRQSVCDYCGEPRRSAPVDELIEHIVASFETEYEDPANCMHFESAEGGYTGETHYIDDLLWDHPVTDNTKLQDDIIGAIRNKLWCQKDYYSLPDDKRLAYGWRDFSEHVKHVNHFFPTKAKKSRRRFPDPDDVSPDQMMKQLVAIFAELGLVKKLPKGTRFIRARTHADDVKLVNAADLGPPPPKYANLPNRMSPAGVSMFYGAKEIKTALREVDYPDSGKAATVGTFETTRLMKVVDLSALPGMPSIYDDGRRHLRPWISFIHDFVYDFTKPIERDNREHVEYVPTQFVTAYIQHKMPGGVRGLIFPSSKVKSGTCCVLFVNNEESQPVSKYSGKRQWLRFLPTSIRRFTAKPKAA